MYDRIKEGWKRSSKRLTGTDAFWERSLAGALLLKGIKNGLGKYGKGALLDAGAGTLSCRYLARQVCSTYTSLDFKQTHPELDHVADIQNMPLSDSSFDTVLCVEVLEHVPNPQKALSEIFRVLKPGGKLVITVPHIGYLHNEPYDFYRYTKHGLRVLLSEAGFDILELEPNGGLIAFLQLSSATVLLGLSEGIPVIQQVSTFINGLMGEIALMLDRVIDRRKLYALHYVAVAERPSIPLQ